MKHKISLAVSAALVVSFSVFTGLRLSHSIFAAAYSTKAECAGIPLTVAATAPSTVTTGSPVSVTNISSTSTSPGGITVNKIVSTSTITNASPTAMSGTWTGNGVNTFTANFPDVSLAAAGASGSQINMALSSIDLYVNGSSTPITCSVANGQLTANAAGESLTVLNIGITAPVSSSSGGSGSTKNGSTSPASSSPTHTTTPTSPSTTSTPATSASSASPQATTVPTTTKLVTVVVTDGTSEPVKNAKVVMDSRPAVFTNSQGDAAFVSVAAGSHRLTVSANKKTSMRTFQLNAKTVSDLTLAVNLPKQKLSTLSIVGTSAASIVVIALIVLSAWRLRMHFSNHSEPQPAYAPPAELGSVIISPSSPQAAPMPITPQVSPVQQTPTQIEPSPTATQNTESTPAETAPPPSRQP